MHRQMTFQRALKTNVNELHQDLRLIARQGVHCKRIGIWLINFDFLILGNRNELLISTALAPAAAQGPSLMTTY